MSPWVAWGLALLPSCFFIILSELPAHRSKMWLRWMAVLWALAGGTGLALLDFAQTWTIGVNPLWEVKAEGTGDLTGLPEPTPQRFEFHLERSDQVRILRVAPKYASGWGCPSQVIEFSFYDPEGQVLARIGRDRPFSCWCVENSGCEVRSGRFLVETSGIYRIEVTPLNSHMRTIELAVLEDTWADSPLSSLIR